MDDLPKNMRNPGHFGPAIIGEEEYAKEQAYRAKGAHQFGTAVTGPPEPQKPTEAQLREQPGLAALHGLPDPTSPSKPAPDVVPVSLEKLEEILTANPYTLDGMIDAEFRRPDVRVGALRMFLKIESGRAEPRADVVTRLETALKE